MSAIRQSFVFEYEDSFGKPNTQHHWIAPPPGSFINTTHNRSTTRVQSAGSKIWDTVAYGQLNGSWEWTFMLDYDYLEPLYFAFEAFSETNNNTQLDTHTYAKKNSGRVHSFTLRRKMLNKMTGGPTDEVEEIYGCVIKNISFSKAAGSSQINVRMTGMFADEKMILGTLPSTDYQEYTGELAEYLCMFVGTDVDSALADCSYVANTDSLEISIENNVEAIYTTCSPFATNYVEGLTNYSFSTSCYSNNPDHYKRRVYTGGYTQANRPMSKGLQPLHKIYLIAYTGSARSYDTTTSDDPPVTTRVEDYDITGPKIIAAYNRANKKICIEITDCVIKSLTWPKGDGSAIMDNISSTECKVISMEVVSPDYIADPSKTADVGEYEVKHRISSADPSNP